MRMVFVLGAAHRALIGVELPAGDHDVRLRYSPVTSKLGLGISLLALAGLAVSGAVRLSRG